MSVLFRGWFTFFEPDLFLKIALQNKFIYPSDIRTNLYLTLGAVNNINQKYEISIFQKILSPSIKPEFPMQLKFHEHCL
jgi:hypothetical protein